MKLTKYLINAKPSWGCGCELFLLASNIKEARNFCKDFDGLKILKRLNAKIDIIIYSSIDDVMNAQKENLQKGLANKTLEIVKE